MNRKNLFQEKMQVKVIGGKFEGQTGKVIECAGCIVVELTSGLEIEIHEDWIEPLYTYYVGANNGSERIFFKVYGIKQADLVADNCRKFYSRVTINEKQPKNNIFDIASNPELYGCKNEYIHRVNNYDLEERGRALHNGYIVEFTRKEYDESHLKSNTSCRELNRYSDIILLQIQYEKSAWEDMFS